MSKDHVTTEYVYVAFCACVFCCFYLPLYCLWFVGITSPVSSTHTGGGGGTTFSSSSLNALQAISDGVGNPAASSLTSPPHKPDSSPSINSTVHPSTGTCKPGLLSFSDSKCSGIGEHPLQVNPHSPISEAPADKPELQVNRDSAGRESTKRVPDTRCHKKLLQLLTSPTEETAPPNQTCTGSSSGPEGDDGPSDVTSPSSSTGVSSSTGGNHGSLSSSGGPGNTLSQSLQEKHKILHKLLQNGNTPDEVARITAEATGKSCLDSSSEPAALKEGSESKQEQHSPKKEKPNALLHYLLNNDDSKESEDVKPKLEKLEERTAQGTGVNSSNLPCMDRKVKMEPSDEVQYFCFIKGNKSILFKMLMFKHVVVVVVFQNETLETILGVPRNNSGFYPEPDSRTENELSSKEGSVLDSLHGKTGSK